MVPFQVYKLIFLLQNSIPLNRRKFVFIKFVPFKKHCLYHRYWDKFLLYIQFVFFFPFSTGAVSARNIMLLKKKQARCQGVVCAMKVTNILQLPLMITLVLL